MFIRKKTIKSQDYAYLVQNKYNKRKKQSRQRSTKYIGKIIKLDKETQVKSSSINESIIQTLKQLKFTHKKDILTFNDITIDLKNSSVSKSNKPVCLEINNGYLCSHTLKKLLDFKPPKSTSKDIAKELASSLVNTGINIDEGSFISIFNSQFKEK